MSNLASQNQKSTEQTKVESRQ